MTAKLILGALAATAMTACGGTTTTTVPLQLNALPGAGSGTAPTAGALNMLTPQVEAIDAAITAGTILPPTTAPMQPVTLNGLVAFESGEGASVGIDEAFIVGNLTMVADFNTGTVTTSASDFAEFNANDPNNLVASTAIWGGLSGTLAGSGTVSLTNINSSLSGTVISVTEGPLPVSTTLSGDVYDNAGTLIAGGDVFPSSTPTQDEGFFILSQ